MLHKSELLLKRLHWSSLSSSDIGCLACFLHLGPLSLLKCYDNYDKVRGQLCTSQLLGRQLCHGLRETEQTAPGRAPGRALEQQDPPLRMYCKKSESQSRARYFRRSPTGWMRGSRWELVFSLLSHGLKSHRQDKSQVYSLAFKSSFENIYNACHFRVSAVPYSEISL